MTTGLKERGTVPQTDLVSRGWQYATVALAFLCILMGYMLSQQRPGHDAMRNTMTGEHYDHGFINMMIPHHEQAIEEARVALREARHPELKQLAQNIIRTQQAEIDQMKQWRRDWYGE